MVSYGAWHDSPEFVETHVAQANGGEGPWVQYDEEAPYARSGWEFLPETLAVRDGSAGTSEYLPGGEGEFPIPNPDFGTAGVSGDAWNTMREQTQLFDASEAGLISVDYHGSINPIEEGGPGSQAERWTEIDWRSILAYGGSVGTDWTTVLAGPSETWPPGAIGVDFDQAPTDSLNDYVHLIEATLQPWTAAAGGSWGLTVKNAGYPVTPDGPYPPNAGTGLALDLDAMHQVMQDNETDPTVPTYAMPFFTIEWTGGWPGDYGGPDHLRLLEDVIVQVVLRYTGPRWRFVFSSVVPPTEMFYRRTYPNDAATETARRTFPPSKALQSGRRTSGNYL